MLEWAAIIAAVAFAALVVFIIWRVSPILKELRLTLRQTNETVDVLTRDADRLLVEVETITKKLQTTLDDVNHKLELTTPFFQAVGDVGGSVSDVNSSTKNLVSKFKLNRKRSGSTVDKVTKTAKVIFKKKPAPSQSTVSPIKEFK